MHDDSSQSESDDLHACSHLYIIILWSSRKEGANNIINKTG